jgi:hypothetical protein
VTTPQRIGVLAVGIVALVLAFVLLRPGGNDNGSTTSSSGAASTAPSASAPASTAPAPAQPTFTTVRVVNGQPQGGIQSVSVKKGDQIRLRVVSDVADEIHVHGYDLKKDVAKGGSVRFSFPATIEGRFEVELENAGTQIADLEVTPS